MSCLGVHFALTDDEVSQLRSYDDDQSRLEYLQEVLEKEYFDQQRHLKADSDKSWDAMHRSLADGYLTWDGGDYPLNHVVLAGELLYSEPDYIMSLKTPTQVHDIAAAMQNLTEDGFRRRYLAIDVESYGCPLTEEDFQYTWESFQEVRDLYVRAAEQGRFVLFTVDQ